jgi:hypothetical protein
MRDAKIVVTFHRTYEVDLSMVHSKLAEDDYEDVDMTEEVMQSKAEEIARDWLADEMPEFVDNTEDFVSATTEIIYPKKE